MTFPASFPPRHAVPLTLRTGGRDTPEHTRRGRRSTRRLGSGALRWVPDRLPAAGAPRPRADPGRGPVLSRCRGRAESARSAFLVGGRFGCGRGVGGFGHGPHRSSLGVLSFLGRRRTSFSERTASRGRDAPPRPAEVHECPRVVGPGWEGRSGTEPKKNCLRSESDRDVDVGTGAGDEPCRVFALEGGAGPL